jgi:uncharacterized integral membrane protein
MRGWGTLLLAALLAALVIVPVFWNGTPITVNLLFASWNTTVGVAVVVAAVLGAAAATMVLTWQLLRLKMEVRRQTRRIAQLEQEVHGLRTLPIASDGAVAPSELKA